MATFTRALQQAAMRRRLASFVPFDGVFFDTAAGDTFSGRFTDPGDAALTVGSSFIAFDSLTTTKTLDIILNDTDGNPLSQCFDYWRWELAGTIDAAWNAADDPGFYLGGILEPSLGTFFGTHVKAHPGFQGATTCLPTVNLNGSPLTTAPSGYLFTAPCAFTVDLKREGHQWVVSWTFDGASQSAESRGPVTLNMVFTASSYELPRYWLKSLLQAKKGKWTITSAKFSASYPNPDLAIIGDSLVQGRFASTYANAWAQLLRADFGGTTLVCGAPSATIEQWTARLYSLLRMQPKKVLVSLGANNITALESAATIQTKLTALHDALVTAGIPHAFTNLPPQNSTTTGTVNAWLAGTGWNVIDIHTGLLGTGNALNATYNSGDGVHWNDAGHALVKATIKTGLQGLGWWI